MPTPQAVHVERYLTNVAIRYAQEADAFIAGKVFPQVPVAKQSDFYVKFPKGYFMRDDMQARPLGGRPNSTEYALEKGSYYAEEWALEHKIDDRVRDNADEPINPDMRGVELLTEKALIHRDREWVEKFFKTGLWATDWEGTASTSSGKKFIQFNAAEKGAEPIKFFDERATEMKETTGRRPNRLVLGADTFLQLKNNAFVLERIKYTMAPPSVVTTGILAALFDVEQVLVAESVYNTAPEGKADKVEFIADPKSAMLVYAAPAPSISSPSAGYTFAWTGLLPGVANAWGGVIYKGREELAHTDVLQIRATYDMQVTASDLGVFLTKAVA